MDLIFGGAYQGKEAYATESLGYPPQKIVPHVEGMIWEMLAAGKDPVAEMPALAEGWADCAILLEDVCCGIVPMDAMERAYREAVGRCGAYLARRARRVTRVFCGLGTVLKDA